MQVLPSAGFYQIFCDVNCIPQLNVLKEQMDCNVTFDIIRHTTLQGNIPGAKKNIRIITLHLSLI